jgi:ParB-like chromosome segregation protein Spo0J
VINEQLQALAVPVGDLIPDPQNARDHDDRNLEAIKASLANHGQQKAIVVNTENVIIAGNGTWMAAKELGWDEVAAVVYDGDGDEDAFALADNRTAELARWNHDVLALKLRTLQEDGFEIETLGWKDYEIAPLLEADWTPPAMTGEDFDSPDDQKMSPLKLTANQRAVVDKAIATMRVKLEDPEAKEGRCVELLCADWLAGN